MPDELDDELEGQPDQRTRIARPVQSAIPPVTLRGLGTPAASGSTENLEERGLASHIARPGPIATPESGSTESLESMGLASHIARPAPTPSPIEARIGSDQTELQRQLRTGSGISQIQHGSPEGGIGIAKPHPIAGGILRGLNTAGEIAGAVFPAARGVLSAIPGTEEHHNMLMGRQRGRIGEDLGEEKEQAGIGETTARTDQAQAAAEKDLADAHSKLNPPDKPPKGPQEIYAEAVQEAVAAGRDPSTDPKVLQLADTITALQKQPPAAKPSSEQNKENFQHGIGVLRGEGLIGAGDVTDFKKIAGGVEKSKSLTSDEKNAMVGYMGANPTPGTNVQVHVQEGAASQSAKDARTHVLATGPDGKTILTTLDKANSQGLDSTPIKDPEAVAQTGRMANTIQISMNRLANPEMLKLFDNPGARAIIATATDDSAARQFGAVIPGIGGLMVPIPGGTSKFIDSVLQNSKLAGADKEAVKKYLAGYWSAREAMMNLMRLQSGGKQGARGQFQAEAAIQQLPGGKTPDSATARLQMEYAQESLDQYRSGIPDILPGFKKEPSFKESSETAGGGTQGGAKTLSMSAIQQAAKDHGVSIDEAKRQAQAAGYAIQ